MLLVTTVVNKVQSQQSDKPCREGTRGEQNMRDELVELEVWDAGHFHR